MKTRISKVVLLTTAVALVLSVNVALAAKGGDPLAVVWTAIADLQHQIDNIQLTPGPQGEPGKDAQHGAGNIAFIHDIYLLKTDGTTWVANSGNVPLSPSSPVGTVPVP